ncbi:MAG: hypothetical protein WA814_06330, partial [Candidatus Baltobacteraceae bacterium]
HLLLPFIESFFFLTSKELLNNCLKCLKRLEVLLGTFGESTGTSQWRHPTAGFLWLGGSGDPREIFPSIYKRNLQEEKYIENISNVARTAGRTSHACLSQRS